MRKYRAQALASKREPLPFTATPGPPRDFTEWAALRRWGKLPPGEQDIPGYLLRQAREEAFLTQSELAMRLGISQPAVAQIERWTSNPTVATMRRWLGACSRLTAAK